MRQGQPSRHVERRRRGPPREADVERSDRLVEPFQTHEHRTPDPVDILLARLEDQGPVALGQGLGVSPGLLEDQGSIQVVAGQSRIAGRR